ncbi:MAG: phage tail protein [Rhodobacterales bacterium 65-51]|uniref:C40 family peptidase n=1 Tax=uncultured Gemmobacter sp. TaxID=1095917 RepID=UPI0009615BBE|nr:NlpC/P60 family protein [uncultured Gemmobacter sp.]OJY25552.1 MAG: phage tail protein [Rhodobacterales bacterium 65-51]
MTWSDRFIGIPHGDLGRDRAGCDCWGLACVIYREELAISLPDYLGYSSAAEQGEVAALMDGAETSPLWLPVEGPAIAFDIAVFRRGRLRSHVGIVVRHGVMIHMADRRAAVLEPYDNGRWKHRFTGHYRHVDLVSEVRR